MGTLIHDLRYALGLLARSPRSRRVLDAVSDPAAFAVTGEGIWFLPPSNFFAGGGVPLRFLSFAGGGVKTITTTTKPSMGPLSVSPDGRWVLYTQVDRSEFDLMLVENFR